LSKTNLAMVADPYVLKLNGGRSTLKKNIKKSNIKKNIKNDSTFFQSSSKEIHILIHIDQDSGFFH